MSENLKKRQQNHNCIILKDICRVDPGVPWNPLEFPGVPWSSTPLEIAAINGNTVAFDLLAPHYEDNTKKKIGQLMIKGLTDSVPSAEFILLFKSVPLAEVGLK